MRCLGFWGGLVGLLVAAGCRCLVFHGSQHININQGVITQYSVGLCARGQVGFKLVLV